MALVLPAPAAEAIESRHGEHVLGTSFELFAAGGQFGLAALAADAALAEIKRLEALLSAWGGASELAALNCANTFDASPDLYAVIDRCEHWRSVSNGAFSARLGYVRELWRDAEHAGRMPRQGDVARLAAAAERAPVELDPRKRRITRPDEVRFDIDGLAKGYILDRAVAAARAGAPQVRGLLIDIGGDMRVWSAADRRDVWRVGVAHPNALHDNATFTERLALSNGALTMSGAGARDRFINGRAHAHTLDPRHGRPIVGVAGAAALASDAADADALATIFSVLAPEQSLALANERADFGAFVVTTAGQTYRSAGWSRRAETPASLCQTTAAASAIQPWPSGYALDIGFEIPPQSDGNYRRPYVAIWISDENRRLVRTLLVLGPQARWREENYVWWRRFERHDLAAVASVARPTRAPGRYEVRWDGRDDAGVLVGRGRFVLNIEASREHGGHSFQSIPLDLDAAPLSLTADAAPELGAARVRYGRAP